MSTTRVKTLWGSVVLLALATTLIWQQMRISDLTVEVADLRVQLGRAAATQGWNRQLAAFDSSTEHSLAQKPFRELLRLRGEVVVLRGQLAETRSTTRKQGDLPPTEQDLRGEQSGLAVLNAE